MQLSTREGCASEGLPPAVRLRRRTDYQKVQQLGRPFHTAHFVMLVLMREELDESRLGITVTRRLGGSVIRNRIKRVVREIYRRNRACFPRGADVVLIAKAGTSDMSYKELQAEILQAAQRVAHALRQRKKTEEK